MCILCIHSLAENRCVNMLNDCSLLYGLGEGIHLRTVSPVPRGGGTLIFSSFVGLDPASTVYQKIPGISGIPKK